MNKMANKIFTSHEDQIFRKQGGYNDRLVLSYEAILRQCVKTVRFTKNQGIKFFKKCLQWNYTITNNVGKQNSTMLAQKYHTGICPPDVLFYKHKKWRMFLFSPFLISYIFRCTHYTGQVIWDTLYAVSGGVALMWSRSKKITAVRETKLIRAFPQEICKLASLTPFQEPQVTVRCGGRIQCLARHYLQVDNPATPSLYLFR